MLLLLLLWFAVQLLSDLGSHAGGASVTFRAHIGGFLAGMLLVPLLKRREVPLFAR
jgi:membrane associated rhomboid family serine protease